MKIEKKEYHGLPYEEVDNLYVRMDKIDFDMMALYFDSVQNNIEVSSKLLDVLREQIEALKEQNGVLKTMLVMKEPNYVFTKKEDGSMETLCPAGDISCPYNMEGVCSLERPWDECEDYYGVVGDKDEEEDEIENFYDPYIGLDTQIKNLAQSIDCTTIIGNYCRAEEKYFLEDEE